MTGPSLVYLGTPEMAVPPLNALVAAGFDVRCVVTGPDRRRGRGRSLSPTPVKAAATSLGIAVAHDVDDALTVGAELGVVVAFGQIIRPHALAVLPMINLHFSSLPRWRGAAPVERAILAGDAETGVCVMDVAEGLDEGDVHASVTVEIGPRETAESLRGRLVEIGSDLLVSTLTQGLGRAIPQSGEVTYAHKIGPETLEVDWDSSAGHIDRQVRVGGAWTFVDGDRLKIWRADVEDGSLAPGTIVDDRVGTGDGVLVLREVQPAGKMRQSAHDWLNGARLAPGSRLGP